MRTRLAIVVLSVLTTSLPSVSARTLQTGSATMPHEQRIAVDKTSLYSREIGRGQPIIMLHGGPDFDHRYFLPDLDRLADQYRLIYYDQRGRGSSAAGVQPGDVTLASEIDDLDRVRRHFKLESAALLGHSWGSVLALEYAIRHPTRVSHLILLNPAPLSTADLAFFRKAYVQKLGPDMDRQRAIMATAAYKEGDPEAVTARYRLHFKPALKQPEHFEKLMSAMHAAFIAQGKEGIVKARAVEDRLMLETWGVETYDLAPKIRNLNVPTVVIYGDADFFPPEIALHIAEAMPKARPVKLTGCGHFAFLECADEVRRALSDFFGR
jgi:proline iminopeptidase